MSPIEARGVVAAAMKKGLIRLAPLKGGGGGKGKKHPPDLGEWLPREKWRQALSVACRLCGARTGEPCKPIGLPQEQAAHWARLLDEDFERGP